MYDMDDAGSGTARVSSAVNDSRAIVDSVRRCGVPDADDTTLVRALYSSDASLYRVVPRLIVRPRSVDEVVATVATCAEVGVPLTARGAGTSIVGNAVGPGVVMDLRRHLNRVRSVDTGDRSATVGSLGVASRDVFRRRHPAVRGGEEHLRSG